MSNHQVNPAFGAVPAHDGRDRHTLTPHAPPTSYNTRDGAVDGNPRGVTKRPDEGAQEPNDSVRSSWMNVKKLLPSSGTSDSLATASVNNSEDTTSLVASKIKSATMKMESGKLLGVQRRHIRSSFLIFSLLLTSFTVGCLAVFGSQATDTAQIQTVGLLGEALVRDVSKDTRSLFSNGERECMHLAVSAPLYFNSS